MGNVDVKVSSGQLEVSKEKNLLVWVLGTSTQYFSFGFVCTLLFLSCV